MENFIPFICIAVAVLVAIFAVFLFLHNLLLPFWVFGFHVLDKVCKLFLSEKLKKQ